MDPCEAVTLTQELCKPASVLYHIAERAKLCEAGAVNTEPVA